jgi:hypothetical protein
MQEEKIRGWVRFLPLIYAVYASAVQAGSMDINTSPVAAIFNRFDPEKLHNINYIGELNPETIKELSEIRTAVFDEGRRYFIDLDRLNAFQKRQARQILAETVGVSFPENWLFVSQHKNSLIYTPLNSLDDPALEAAVNRGEENSKPRLKPSSYTQVSPPQS